jgi:hypothetical protein
MSVLYIKSMGTELKELEKENKLLRKIIKKQNVMIEHIATLMANGCFLTGTKEQIIEEMERKAKGEQYVQYNMV